MRRRVDRRPPRPSHREVTIWDIQPPISTPIRSSRRNMISSPIRRGALRRLSSLNDLQRSSIPPTPNSTNGSRYLLQARHFSTAKVAYQATNRPQPPKPAQRVSNRNATTATAPKTATPIKPPVGRPTPSLSNNSKLTTDAPPANPPTSLQEPSPADLTNPANRRALTDGLLDSPPPTSSPDSQVDWSTSFQGLSNTPFSKEAQEVLLQPVNPDDVEIKPDGIVYLPEIKYRRILNRAFGPGAWGLAPRGETIVTGKCVTREYGLVVHGR